jgi:hypothetical protein
MRHSALGQQISPLRWCRLIVCGWIYYWSAQDTLDKTLLRQSIAHNNRGYRGFFPPSKPIPKLQFRNSVSVLSNEWKKSFFAYIYHLCSCQQICNKTHERSHKPPTAALIFLLQGDTSPVPVWQRDRASTIYYLRLAIVSVLLWSLPPDSTAEWSGVSGVEKKSCWSFFVENAKNSKFMQKEVLAPTLLYT